MEQRHRALLDNCEDVVSKIDIVKLWPKLLEHKIYNRDDVNIPKWTKNLTAESTIRDVYLTIKTRGPKAFENLLLSLRQSGHKNVADILEEKINNNWESDVSLQHEHDVQRSSKPLKIILRKSAEFLDHPQYDSIQRYPMRSKPRGLVLIITNIHYKEESPRLSAQHDETNLKQLFEQMGFKVIRERNLTGQQIKEVVKNFSEKRELEKVDSCFVIITSHGTEDEKNNTEIQGIDYPSEASDQGDYEKVRCTDIMDYFTAEACPYLAEKPKIFIFQLCRGKKSQNAVHSGRVQTDTCVFPKKTNEFSLVDMHPNKATRNFADMLVVQSTLPGHVAYRDSINGSWFIQIFCKVFMNYACSKHIQDLLNMVDAELKGHKTADDQCQTSCIKSIGFNKHCYINPGLFDQEYNEEQKENDRVVSNKQ